MGSKGNNRKKAEKGKENEKQRPPDLSFLFGPPLRNGKPKKQKPNPRPTPPANVDELKNPNPDSKDDQNNLQAFKAELTLRYSMPLNIIKMFL